MYAGHLPKLHFDAAALDQMPVVHPDFDGFLNDGFYRSWDDAGKPFVFYCAPWGTEEVSYAVRPVVRVKARTSFVYEGITIIVLGDQRPPRGSLTF